MATNNDFPNLTRVLNEYGTAIVENYKRALTDKNVNASFDLYNSVKYIVEKDNGRFEVNIELMEYWRYLEVGRKAGKFPPINKIAEWIKIKPILPRPMANGKLPTAEQLTFLISRSIAENGIKPKPLLQDRVDNVNLVFWRDIEDAVAEDLGLQVNVLFKEIGLV